MFSRMPRPPRQSFLDGPSTVFCVAVVLLGRTVDGLLRRRGGVDRRHEAALDAEGVVEDLRDGREAVRRAGGVGDDVLTGVGRVVHAVDEHRGRVLGRSGHDDLLGAGRDVGARLLVREEQARGLDDDLGADVAPLEGGRILLRREADRLAVNDEVRAVDLDVVLEDPVHGIVLEHVREVVRVEEVVDADDLDVIREVLDRGAEHHATDTAEAVDTNLNCHFFTPCGPVEAPTSPEKLASMISECGPAVKGESLAIFSG